MYSGAQHFLQDYMYAQQSLRSACASAVAWRGFASLATNNVHCKDSYQTARMRRWIRVVCGSTWNLLVGNSVTWLVGIYVIELFIQLIFTEEIKIWTIWVDAINIEMEIPTNDHNHGKQSPMAPNKISITWSNSIKQFSNEHRTNKTKWNCNRNTALDLPPVKLLAGSTLVLLVLNHSHPEFMKWTFPSLNLDLSIIANRDVNQKSKQNGTA